MRLTIRKFFPEDPDSDLYIIERAEHDGREWYEPSARFPAVRSQVFCKSSRLCGTGGYSADIEGSRVEMLDIAAAIRSRRLDGAKRCYVDATQEPVLWGSPRNDNDQHGESTYEEADDLAGQIERLFAVG